MQQADVGHSLAVRVTAADAGGTGSADSAQTAAVTNPAPPLAPPTSLAPPLVSGNAQESSTLSATDGLWAGAGTLTYARRWQRCNPVCVDVAGATFWDCSGLHVLAEVTADLAGAGRQCRIVGANRATRRLIALADFAPLLVLDGPLSDPGVARAAEERPVAMAIPAAVTT